MVAKNESLNSRSVKYQIVILYKVVVAYCIVLSQDMAYKYISNQVVYVADYHTDNTWNICNGLKFL